MIRRLYIVACGVSLLLCVAATVLWAMSLRPRVWWFGPDRPDASIVIELEHGTFWIHNRTRSALLSNDYYSYELWRPFVATAVLWIAPILFRTFRSTLGALLFAVFLNLTAMPLGGAGAPLVLVCDILLLFVLLDALPKRKDRPGICAFCGYDLRATPDRCPECGRVPDRQVRAGV